MPTPKHVLSHFQNIDPVLAAVLVKAGLTVTAGETTAEFYFKKLCRDIIGQQLSGKAADTIVGRFYGLLGSSEADFFPPEKIAEFTDEQLRGVGMSWAKVRSVRDLADKVSQKEVRLDKLSEMSDNEVIAELTKVKGIGPWTAQMFLIFTLGRENVFSPGDLGLKKAIEKLYPKVKTEKQLLALLKKWHPYRSYASLALWWSLDNRPKSE